jgi:hypothetical protein
MDHGLPRATVTVSFGGVQRRRPTVQEAGIEFLDTPPSVEFEFLGKNASLPARLHVEVASCWSLISSIENRQSWITALIGLAKPKGLSYSNLCQIVQLEIPSTPREDCEYMPLTDAVWLPYAG